MPNPSISNGALLNTDQAAAMLGVHPKTLQRLARSGRITAYRVGKLWRFQACDLWADVAVRVAPLNELHERVAPIQRHLSQRIGYQVGLSDLWIQPWE